MTPVKEYRGVPAVLMVAASVMLLISLNALDRATEAVAAVPEPAGFEFCTVAMFAPSGLDYYQVRMSTVGNAPGLSGVEAVGIVQYAKSLYAVALSKDGHYVYELRVEVDGLRQRPNTEHVVWVMPPDLEPVQRIGSLDADGTASGTVSFNKFIVIVTREAADTAAQEKWTGPIILRGMSRSGYMHTMAGHGPFGQEPCQNLW